MINDINLITISKLSLEDLKTPEGIAIAEELAADDQYLAEPMAAREFYDAILSIRAKYKTQIEGSEISERLHAIEVKMMWQALSALEKKAKQQILTSDIIFALKNNIDIVAQLDRYLNVLEFGMGPDYDERQIFLSSLTQNQEILGSQSLVLRSGDKVNSYISNWIKDYISYTDPKSLKGRSYDLTQYMYSTPNVKNISADQKQLLANVIGIYNYLRYPKYIPIIEPEEVSPKESSKAPVATQEKIPVISPQTLKPTKELTEFEKKLAAVSAAAPKTEGGQDLAALRRRVSQAPAPTPIPAPMATAGRITSDEIKREVAATELPPHMEPKISTPVKKMQTLIQPVVSKPAAPAVIPLGNLDEVKTLDDLKKVGLDVLRRGNILSQTQAIKSKIVSTAASNKALPYYAVTAFEQSPLFKSYLAHGQGKFEGKDTGELSQAEFEAIADLRKEIERL